VAVRDLNSKGKNLENGRMALGMKPANRVIMAAKMEWLNWLSVCLLVCLPLWQSELLVISSYNCHLLKSIFFHSFSFPRAFAAGVKQGGNYLRLFLPSVFFFPSFNAPPSRLQCIPFNVLPSFLPLMSFLLLQYPSFLQYPFFSFNTPPSFNRSTPWWSPALGWPPRGR
jgi:hypothetical protein